MSRLIDWISYLRLMVLYIATVGYVFARNIPGMNLGLMLGVSALVSGLCIYNSHRSGWHKYWPLVLCALYFVPFNGILSILCILPLIILLVRSTVKTTWHTTFDMTLMGLRIGVPVYILMAIFTLPSDMGGLMDLPTRSLPLFVLFLAMTLFGMRILRHEDIEQLDKQYVLINLGLVVVVSAVALLLSSTWLMHLLIGLFGLIYRYILMPVLAAAMYILIVIPYGLYMLISWILSKVHYKPLPQEVEEGAGRVSQTVYQTAEEMVGGDLLVMVFRGIAILVFIIIMIVVIRKMGGAQERVSYSTAPLKRETTRKEEKRHRSIFSRRSTSSVIRDCYLQFLKITAKKQIPVDGSIASDAIAGRASTIIGSDEPQRLRSLWIPIRYGESPDESAAHEAKELLKTIRKKYKED